MIIQYSILLPSTVADNTLAIHEQSQRQILFSDENNNGSSIGASLLSPVTGTLHILSPSNPSPSTTANSTTSSGNSNDSGGEKLTLKTLKQYWPYEGNFHFRAQVIPASEPNNYVWMDLVNEEAYIPPLPVSSVTSLFSSSSSPSSPPSASSSSPPPPLIAVIRAIPLFPLSDAYNDTRVTNDDYSLSPIQYDQWKRQYNNSTTTHHSQPYDIQKYPLTVSTSSTSSSSTVTNDNNPPSSSSSSSPYATYPLSDDNDIQYGNTNTTTNTTANMVDRVDEQIQQQIQAASLAAKEAVSAATSMFKGFMSKAKVTVKNITNNNTGTNGGGDNTGTNTTHDKSTGDPFG